MSLEVTTELSDRDTAAAWQLYMEAFSPLMVEAVQRHVMRHGDFLSLAATAAVDKYLWRSDAGSVTGLGMMTSHLWTVDLIEPTYFEHHWPDQYTAGRIHYVIFVCTDQQDPDAFHAIIDAMTVAAGPGAVVAMDSCKAVDVRGMPTRAQEIVQGRDPDVQLVEMDTQTYRAWILSD